ncbi:MAG TPA: guanylate kinase [Acidimicrobiales bacterium]|nr:guanylate kinase [Acidimicrobiales bacterium]
MILVLSGPGGAGKGTVAARLVERDPALWLSRSWTTRAQRPGESDDAYEFVDRVDFEKRMADGGFLEWAEFLGQLYGTPHPEPPPGMDVLLEIDLQGAAQVRERDPDALIVLLLPPSPEIQAERLRRRGDDEAEVARRLETGAREERVGRALTSFVVVNNDVDQAVAEVAGILEAHRRAGPESPGGVSRGGA